MSISIPNDDEGYLGRECPQKDCLGYFKVKPGTGLEGSNLPCHCPYCGHTAGFDNFWTPEQLEYVESVVHRKFSDAFFKDLKKLEFNHRPKGAFGIGVRLEVKQGQPVPIRHYREKRLETEIVCDSCTLHYAIYGLFGFCADCGCHNSYQILDKNLDLVVKQLDLCVSLEDDRLREHLVEDALENCVSAFDGFGRETCRVRAHHSLVPTKAQSISFQNPGRFSAQLSGLFSIDLRGSIPEEDWSNIHRAFMKRHVIAHRAGVVDQKYLEETSDIAAIVGRRLKVSDTEVRELARLLRTLGKNLIENLPNP